MGRSCWVTRTALKRTQLTFLLLTFLLCASFPLPPSPWVLRAGVIRASSDQSSSGRNSLRCHKTESRPAVFPGLPSQGLPSAHVPLKTCILPWEPGVAPSFTGILSNQGISSTSPHLEAIPGKPQLLAGHCQGWSPGGTHLPSIELLKAESLRNTERCPGTFACCCLGQVSDRQSGPMASPFSPITRFTPIPPRPAQSPVKFSQLRGDLHVVLPSPKESDVDITPLGITILSCISSLP